MDQLENQVNDLRYLTQNVISPAADMRFSNSPPVSSANGINSAYGTAHGAAPYGGSGPGTEPGAASKRKGEDSASKQERAKRNRYISIACNECKRRKIRCNGETPCQRCGNLNLQCLYSPNCCSGGNVKDSAEFKMMETKVSRLQEQVETLFSNMNALRSETLRLAPLHDRLLPLPPSSTVTTPSSVALTPPAPTHRPDLAQLRHPGFRGPTSTYFSLDVAKNTLHKMGYSNLPLGDSGEENGNAPEDTPRGSPMVAQTQAPQDPLWEFDKDEMMRLCHFWEEEVGIMHPIVRIETYINHAKTLSSWMEVTRKNGFIKPYGQDSLMSDHRTLHLKLIMACSLLVEGHGRSEKAVRIFESVQPITDKLLTSGVSDVSNMALLTLAAGYRYFSNDEIFAWRTMGQVMRQCIELGLHRCDALFRIEDEETRSHAITNFWTAYVLDRRWSFGAGLPFVVSDEEIDPHLPPPDSPYLVGMVSYSQLSARVWRLVRHFEPNASLDLSEAAIEDLDCQIKEWYSSAHAEIQLELPDWESLPNYVNPTVHSKQEYIVQRLQIWTYLRLNQIRIWLHTPVLHTHSSIMDNLQVAERAVKLAKNTIKYLSHMYNTTNLYRKLQVFYHQFLTSAIAVLFLASCHAPVNFSASCRDEFYMALELVKDLSSSSWVSKRLWRTIKSLKEVAPRLGLSEDPHSSAALTMAGLATGHVAQTPSTSGTTPPVFPRVGVPIPDAPSTVCSEDGMQISTEMSKMFDSYTGIATGAFSTAQMASVPAAGAGIPAMDSAPHFASVPALGGTGSVYQHFRDMF